jgi:hypothetical protein
MRTISLEVLFLHLVNNLQASGESVVSAERYDCQISVTLTAQAALARFRDVQAARSGHDYRMKHLLLHF